MDPWAPQSRRPKWVPWTHLADVGADGRASSVTGKLAWQQSPGCSKRWSELHDTGLKWTSVDHIGHLADGCANGWLSQEHFELSQLGTESAQWTEATNGSGTNSYKYGMGWRNEASSRIIDQGIGQVGAQGSKTRLRAFWVGLQTVAASGCRWPQGDCLFGHLGHVCNRISRRPACGYFRVGMTFGQRCQCWGTAHLVFVLGLYSVKRVLAVATQTYCNLSVVHYVIKDWHCARAIYISCVSVGWFILALFLTLLAWMDNFLTT